MMDCMVLVEEALSKSGLVHAADIYAVCNIGSFLSKSNSNLHAFCFSQDTNVSTWKQYREQIHICIDKLLDSFLSGNASLLGALSKIKDVADNNGPVRHVKNKFCEILRPQLKEDSSSTELATVFMIDDNFFYRSMRYEYYQMARKCK